MSPRARSNLLRVVIAVAVIGAVVWWLQARTQTTRDGAGPNVASAAGSAGAPSGARGGSGERVVSVQTAAAEKEDLPIWLEGLGTVTANQQVVVRAQVDGRLDKVLFTEGQQVKRGDVLAQIDPRPFMVQLHQAQGALARDRAQLQAAKKNHERLVGLHAQNLIAEAQVEEAAAARGQGEGTVQIDQAAVENARLQLDYAQVKSPIDGVTGVRQIDAGNLVKASDPTGLVVITAIDPVAVLFTVPQDKLTGITSALARGEVPVEVWNRDGSSKLAQGTLAVLDNQVNQATSTLRLKAMVPNTARLLWPQAFVKARMLIEMRKQALVVPAVAVQRGPQGTFVYVVGPDKIAQLKPVTVDLTTGDKAVISKGLEGGEQVVVEGQNQIRPGGRVEPARPAVDKPTGTKAPGKRAP